MIRPLRRAHGLAWAVLAVALPLAYGLALASRPPRPLPTPATPAAWAAPTAAAAGDPLPLAPGPLALTSDSLGAWRLVAVGDASALPPGLLLYASAAPAAAGDPLPAGAVLLAAARPDVELRPPAGARSVLLYSAIDGAVIGAARLPEDDP